MATNFSANQYENAYAANRLQNYQVPHNFKEHPTARKGCTKIISNDRGHLLSEVPRSKESPWGNFKGTWDDDLDFCKKRVTKNAEQQQLKTIDTARHKEPSTATERSCSPGNQETCPVVKEQKTVTIAE